MAMKYAGDSALRYFKTKLVALINAAKSAADTAQATANSAASAAATAQSTANSAVSAANANASSISAQGTKISQNASSITSVASYMFGGRTYATFSDAMHLRKTINLPSAYANYDVNGYYVSVLPNIEMGNALSYYVSKRNGVFDIWFRHEMSPFNSNYIIWFDYIVIINH